MRNQKVRPIEVSPPADVLEALLAGDPRQEIAKLTPSEKNYYLVPSDKPALRPFFRSVQWDCVNQTLEVLAIETKNFDVYNWLDNLKKFDSSNVDLGLVIFNHKEEKIATLRLEKITICGHQCVMNTDTEEDFAPLKHKISLRYFDSSVLASEEGVDLEVDQEWNKRLEN